MTHHAPHLAHRGGILAHELDAICPDDTALYLPPARAVVFADGVVRGGPYGGDGPLGFVPDSLVDAGGRTAFEM